MLMMQSLAALARVVPSPSLQGIYDREQSRLAAFYFLGTGDIIVGTYPGSLTRPVTILARDAEATNTISKKCIMPALDKAINI